MGYICFDESRDLIDCSRSEINLKNISVLSCKFADILVI
jgi:hypothetical protein